MYFLCWAYASMIRVIIKLLFSIRRFEFRFAKQYKLAAKKYMYLRFCATCGILVYCNRWILFFSSGVQIPKNKFDQKSPTKYWKKNFVILSFVRKQFGTFCNIKVIKYFFGIIGLSTRFFSISHHNAFRFYLFAILHLRLVPQHVHILVVMFDRIMIDFTCWYSILKKFLGAVSKQKLPFRFRQNMFIDWNRNKTKPFKCLEAKPKPEPWCE